MKTIQQLKQEFADFANLDKIKNILVITDDDEDGYTSALQLKRFLENKNCVVKVVFNDKSDLTKDKFLKKVGDFNYELVFFLDLNEEIIGMYSDVISKECLIIDVDHHPSPKINLIKNKLLLLKPQSYSDKQPSQHSTTGVVYDLFEGNDLLASIGLIGDSAYPQWKSFIDDTAKQYGVTVENLSSVGDVIKCVANIHQELMYDLFDFLYNNLDVKKIMNSRFYKLKEEFDKVVKSETLRFEKEAEKNKDADITFFRTLPHYTSKMSNVLSKITSGTLVVYSGDDTQIKGSVRRPDFKINSGELIKFAIKNALNAQGGGHIPAGGFHCEAEYIDEFKKRAILFMNDNLVK
ncbi:MAG: DHH family phosphoesterase [archaeon]|jgi:single-stranded DNA-specific DHH superfamily exonuclease